MVRIIVAAAAVAFMVSTSLSDRNQPRTSLSQAEMDDTVGGVSVTSFDFPPGDNMYQPQDNQQFRLSVANALPDPVSVGLFEGNTKYTMGVINATNGGSESLRMRALAWPLDTVKRDLILKYYDNGWANASGPGRNDVHLPSALKVAKVRFYHLREPGGTNPTSVAHSLSGLVDNPEYYYNWQDTPASDAITGQCSGDERWNFRYHTVTTESVPDGCTRIRTGRGCGAPGQPACPSGSGDRCPQWATVMDDMIDDRAAADGTDPDDYVHVIFFNSYQRWSSSSGTWKGYVGWAPGGGRKWVLVSDGLSEWNMSKTLTHEIGHRQGLCHVNDNTCSQYIAANDCGDAARDRNLMCSSSGRQLLANQCQILSDSTRFHDWL